MRSFVDQYERAVRYSRMDHSEPIEAFHQGMRSFEDTPFSVRYGPSIHSFSGEGGHPLLPHLVFADWLDENGYGSAGDIIRRSVQRGHAHMGGVGDVYGTDASGKGYVAGRRFEDVIPPEESGVFVDAKSAYGGHSKVILTLGHFSPHSPRVFRHHIPADREEAKSLVDSLPDAVHNTEETRRWLDSLETRR